MSHGASISTYTRSFPYKSPDNVVGIFCLLSAETNGVTFGLSGSSYWLTDSSVAFSASVLCSSVGASSICCPPDFWAAAIRNACLASALTLLGFD